MAACPYGSRSFNWVDPRLALDLDHLTSDYPTRTRGVVEKCDLCEERLAKGLIPACVDACKARALVFGDLEDPGSQVSKVLQSHYSIVRKPDLGTRPQVYYIV
jgi:molybdopterin-containing oxidoreductase family iron-sulfur binding subunit